MADKSTRPTRPAAVAGVAAATAAAAAPIYSSNTLGPQFNPGTPGTDLGGDSIKQAIYDLYTEEKKKGGKYRSKSRRRRSRRSKSKRSKSRRS